LLDVVDEISIARAAGVEVPSGVFACSATAHNVVKERGVVGHSNTLYRSSRWA